MTPAVRRFREQLRDYRWYAKTFLWIKTKQAGGKVRLAYNVAQDALFRVWDEMERAGRPVRILVLKARRMGISTGVAGRFVHRVATRRNTNAQVVAHDDEATSFLFEMYRLMHEELPAKVVLEDGKRVQVRPQTRYSSKRELVYEELRSQIQIQTAGADRGAGVAKTGKGRRSSGRGRSKTLHLLHCSEVAHWPNAKETLAALLQTVANVPGTVVVLESTANGVGDEFHRRCLDAQAGRSEYALVFLPWWMFPEYQAPVPPEGLGDLDDEEQLLREQFKVTDEQLQWRRQTIRNEFGGDVELFHQEYPSTVEEAFLTSGRPFFNRAALARARAHARNPVVGKLAYKQEGGRRRVEFVQDPTGYLRVWAPPKEYGAYCIGADTAEGLEHGDYSAAEVYDRDTGEQVAEWHGHMDPDEFGRELVKLARWYNDAWLGPESNKDGLTTCKAIVKEGYYRLFERKRLDERIPEDTDKLGWQTNAQTRPVMLNDMEELIREGQLIMRSEILQGECWTFVRDATGRPAAQEGCNDDTVIAMAIAIQMHKLCPMTRPISPQERRRRQAQRAAAIKPRGRFTRY